MKTKKVFIAIAAMLLVCAMSIAGTLAFLQARTEKEVTNTFVAAGSGSLFTDATGKIVLNESKAILNEATGTYTLDTANKVYENEYSVLPGTTVAKDPAITVTGKNNVPAYVYVEIVDATGVNITWEIATGWEATGVVGPHGGTVYHLPSPIVADLAATAVLKNNQITVADEADLGLNAGKDMTFYGYIAQSVVGNSTTAADVFTACFPANNN